MALAGGPWPGPASTGCPEAQQRPFPEGASPVTVCGRTCVYMYTYVVCVLTLCVSWLACVRTHVGGMYHVLRAARIMHALCSDVALAHGVCVWGVVYLCEVCVFMCTGLIKYSQT